MELWPIRPSPAVGPPPTPPPLTRVAAIAVSVLLHRVPAHCCLRPVRNLGHRFLRSAPVGGGDSPRAGGGDDPSADVRGVQPAGDDVSGVLRVQQQGAVLPCDGLPLLVQDLLCAAPQHGPRRHVHHLAARQAHLPGHAP
ncbi:hypothetical protein VPH35_059439 [Triticum aestivum]